MPATPGLEERIFDPETIAALADRSHLTALRDKYQGTTTSTATQLDVIVTITNRNYALIPFSVDHLGRLGYTVHRFLGLPVPIFLPTKPPWDKPSDLSSTDEFFRKAHKFAEASIPIYLRRYLPHGNSVFQQTVSLNFSLALAHHLANARNKLSNPPATRRHAIDILGSLHPFPKRHYHDRFIFPCTVK